MTKPRVTLDTNAIINHCDRASTSATSRTELDEIMQRWGAGEIDVAITTRIEADLWQDKDSVRRDAILKQIETVPVLGTSFRNDF